MSVYRICRKRLCAAVAGCLAPAWVLAGGMEFFEGSFDEALAEAEAGGKMVFVDIYTTWCGPCKVMDATVLSQEDVGDYYNARFVNVKLDAEDEAVNGPAISERYDVGGYPTYLYLKPDGSVIGRISAVLPPSLFIEVAGRLIEGAQSGFERLEKRYEAGEREPGFVQDYLWAAQIELAMFEGDVMAGYARSDKISGEADQYFSSRDFSELINPRDFTLVANYKGHAPRGDPLMEYVIGNYDAFLAVAPEITLAHMVLESNYYATLNAAQSGDEQYRSYLDELDGALRRAADYEAGREPDSVLIAPALADMARIDYLAATAQWDVLHAEFQRRLDAPDSNRRGLLLGAAANLGRADDPEYKNLALAYAREAYELDPADFGGVYEYVAQLAARGDDSAAEQVIEAFLASAEGKSGASHELKIMQSQLEALRD